MRGLAARAEADGGIVISGSAVDVGEQLPLWPVATGLRRLARAADDAPDRVLAARAALEPWREELRPLLDGGAVPAPSGGQLLELVRRVLVGLAARAPVLLVIDDLHWADRTTRELRGVAGRPPLRRARSWSSSPPAPTPSTSPTRCAGCCPSSPATGPSA